MYKCIGNFKFEWKIENKNILTFQFISMFFQQMKIINYHIPYDQLD